MLSLSKFSINKPIKFLNSDLDLSYNQRDSLLGIDVRGTTVTVPIDHKSLEIVSSISSILDDARSGHMPRNAWENPIVQDLDKRINPNQKIALSYYILLSFMGKCDTREIWKVFKGSLHHSLVSYLRNRVISKELAIKYKVAILTCYLCGYNITDLKKIEQTFLNCGLSADNYIFYFLLCLDRLNNFIFEPQESYILSPRMLDKEARDFIETPQIKKLSFYHTNKSLSFIVKSHKFSVEDLAAELQIATQISYLTVRPFKTKLYCENYARRAMTNTVARIQHAYTKYESNIRMVKSGDGEFENTHIILTSKTRNIDASHEQLASTLGFSEDSMIDYLDARKSRAA